MDQLDVLIVGGNYGSGTRAGGLFPTHFLCAVAVPSDEGKPKQFHSFCKVGSGYTRSELYELNQKLASHWKQYDKSKPPEFLELATGQKQRPDLWIEPANSCVLQIKAAEMMDSSQFKTGCTLRFPRVETIRTDKHWYDAMTTVELQDLKQKSEGKLAKCNINEDPVGEPSKKKRKTFATSKPALPSRFQSIDVSTVSKISDLFSGKEICVVNGPKTHPKSSLETLIVQNGGNVVQHPGDNTFCVLADQIVVKVRNMMTKSNHDIVKSSWLLKCIGDNTVLAWLPSDIIHTSTRTALKFSQEYDPYGDSYYNDTDVDMLKSVFMNIDDDEILEMNNDMIAEAESNYFPDDSFYGLFRRCKVYLDNKIIISDSNTTVKDSSLELVALDLRFHGATLTNTLDKKVTHVIVDEKDLSRLNEINIENRMRSSGKFHLVKNSWIEACLESKVLIEERLHRP